MNNINKIRKVKTVEDIVIDQNAKGQTFELENGVTMAFVGQNEYFLIYKVMIHLHSHRGVHTNIEKFEEVDIRRSKRKAEAFYDKMVKTIERGMYSPDHPYDYDPSKGNGISVELAVSEMDYTFNFNIDHIYKTTYSINNNLSNLWKSKAKKVIDGFEEAQDIDNRVREK